LATLVGRGFGIDGTMNRSTPNEIR